MPEEKGLNPHWNKVLAAIPAEYHNQIIPTLREWDGGVTRKFQEIHKQYEDYKPYEDFVKQGLDPSFVQQSVQLANELQADPRNTVSRINEAWNLGYVAPEAAAQLQQPPVVPDGSGFLDDGDVNVDITQHPQFKAMYESLQTLQSKFEQTNEERENERLLEEFEAELDTAEQSYKAKNLPFDREFVTALVAQDNDIDTAVTKYHQILAAAGVNLPSGEQTDVSAAQESTTDFSFLPMGTEGTAGSGVAQQPVNFGSMKVNDLNATVEQLLAQQMQSNQG
jgi:hypothetical protein